MKNEIITNLSQPGILEKMYRANKTQFARDFDLVYPQIQKTPQAEFWFERLHYTPPEPTLIANRELLLVGILTLAAGLIARLPISLHLNEEFFYPRNIGFIIFPALITYFAWRNRIAFGKVLLIAGATLLGAVFINLHPGSENSDTLVLSCIHLLLFLWSVLGFSFVNSFRNNSAERLNYLKFNGDLVVITTLIIISGGILTGVTIGLFTLIGIQIEEFYFRNVVVFGLPAAPIFGTYLIQNNPNLVGRISPVIARLFSPLVLVMLVIYLVAMVYSGKDPYNDRDFLILFNLLLVGVMAIIFFSIAETTLQKKKNLETWILVLLSMVTIVVNCVALSAIWFRISEWGITPNRAAVLGANIIMLLHLLLITWQIGGVLFRNNGLTSVKEVIANYLPVYVIWTILVTFVFPFLFGFK